MPLVTRALLAATLVTSLLGVARADAPQGIPPHQHRVEVRIGNGSKYLADDKVEQAVAGAIQAWNAALPADLQLVKGPDNGPYPPGEVVFIVRFSDKKKDFGGKAIDEAADTRPDIEQDKNRAATLIMVSDHEGDLSVDGSPGTRDLQLVLMHELGHALGVDHADDATTMPPIMAPALDENSKLLANGKKLESLRQVTQIDRECLVGTVNKRKARDLTGTFTGTLKVEKLIDGTLDTLSGHELPVKDGDLVIKYEAGKYLLDYKGSKRELPGVAILQTEVQLEFPDDPRDDHHALRTLTIHRGATPGEFDITMVFQPLRAKYEVRGTLKRK
jgi:hypothetical protein